MLEQKPDAKIALLYQNDDFGKDYLVGLKDVLGDASTSWSRVATYEVTDPTDRQPGGQLQGAGQPGDLAATPKFAAQAIRKVSTRSAGSR